MSSPTNEKLRPKHGENRKLDAVADFESFSERTSNFSLDL